MNLDDIRNELLKNTEILHNTFENVGLKCEKVGYGSFDEDGWFQTYIEVSGTLEKDVELVVNCYDYDGELIFSNSKSIIKDYFSGYTTETIHLQENELLIKTVKTKVFAKYY